MLMVTRLKSQVIERAGAVIYQYDSDGLWFALVTSRSDRNRLVLPAGLVEPGESLRAAAEREAMEEAGLHIECGDSLGTYRHIKASGRPVPTKVYLAEMVEESIACEDRDLYWVRAEEVASLGRHVADGVMAVLMRAERALHACVAAA